MPEAWRVRRAEGHPADLHRLDVAEGRVLRWCRPDRDAVVLGSTQPLEHLDLARVRAAGFEVVRRRSGGGAVLVGPGRLLWADFIIPAEDRLWDDDVGRAAGWVGETWSRALAALGVEGLDVHRGVFRRSAWSDQICFAGLGAGEVTVGDRKLVGVSQRRTRRVTLFQSAALLSWEPAVLAAVLSVAPPLADVAALAMGLEEALPGIGGRRVEAAVEEALPG